MTASAKRPEPPYVRIVAEIRRRIDAGELREGDRVPSARQITKEWGVAIATATKVLAALRQEGLVHPRPGIGTVVAARPTTPQATRPTAPHATSPTTSQATSPTTSQATSPTMSATGSAAPAVVPQGAEPPAAPRDAGADLPALAREISHAAPPPSVPSTMPASTMPENRTPGGGPPSAPDPGTPRQPASPRRPARDPDKELTRERILGVAVEVADTEGLAALSMRRIATELGVATMSLYRHVPGKDELIVLMCDAVFGAAAYPDPPPATWRQCVEIGARTQWAIYRRHPWAAQPMSFTRPILAPNAVVHTEWLLRSLDGMGLTDEHLLHLAVTVANYVRGTAVNLEMEAEARRDTGITDEEWMEEQDATFSEVFVDGRYPIMARISLRPDIDLNLDSLFEFGLARLLDGIEALLNTAERGRS